MMVKFCAAVALSTSVFLLGCSSDSPHTVDTQTLEEEASLVTAEAIKSFNERFAQDVRTPEVVQIPASINIDDVASLIRPEFKLQHGVPSDAASYWHVVSVSEKSTYWEVVIESVAGQNFFAGSQFFVRQENGSFLPVEAKEIGETPTTVVS